MAMLTLEAIRLGDMMRQKITAFRPGENRRLGTHGLEMIKF